MTGATSVVMKSRIVSRSSACSGERSKSIGPSLPSPERAAGDDALAFAECPSCRTRLPPAVTLTGLAAGTGAATVQGASTLRRELLVRLRRDGPSSPDQLATALGASRTGVLQQLRALEAAHLVRRETVRHGVGRPRHVYDVTEHAQDLFPADYDGLATGLLAAIESVGGDDLVDEVFEARRRMATERVRERLAERLPAGASVVDRARELAVIQDEQGYLAEAVARHRTA